MARATGSPPPTAGSSTTAVPASSAVSEAAASTTSPGCRSASESHRHTRACEEGPVGPLLRVRAYGGEGCTAGFRNARRSTWGLVLQSAAQRHTFEQV